MLALLGEQWHHLTVCSCYRVKAFCGRMRMRIGELAGLSGSDVETVRFYDREGLLDAPARETNGYRN